MHPPKIIPRSHLQPLLKIPLVNIVLGTNHNSTWPCVTYGAFLASAQRESSVAVCKQNYGIFRGGVQHYTRASGHARLLGPASALR